MVPDPFFRPQAAFRILLFAAIILFCRPHPLLHFQEDGCPCRAGTSFGFSAYLALILLDSPSPLAPLNAKRTRKPNTKTSAYSSTCWTRSRKNTSRNSTLLSGAI